jgi:hypothetical protein
MSEIGNKALEHDTCFVHARAGRIPLWGLTALAASLITIVGFAVHGFGENGLRLGSQLAWRFALLVYVAAISSGPLTRLLRIGGLWRADQTQRQLLWGFCASFGVFLASLLLPNTFAPVTLEHQGLTIGMMLFVLFAAGLTMVIVYAAMPRPNLGKKIRRALLGVGLGYFWMAYAMTSLSRLYDPDVFYEISLLLLVATLLLGLADRIMAGSKVRKGAASDQGP